MLQVSAARRSLGKIAQFLREQLGVTMSHETVGQVVRRGLEQERAELQEDRVG